MSRYRKKFRFADAKYRDVDLTKHRKLIIDTINQAVPNKHPKVFKDYFSTDPLTQSEAVQLGRALAKLEELNGYGKVVITFRLFEGKLYESEDSEYSINEIRGKHSEQK